MPGQANTDQLFDELALGLTRRLEYLNQESLEYSASINQHGVRSCDSLHSLLYYDVSAINLISGDATLSSLNYLYFLFYFQ